MTTLARRRSRRTLATVAFALALALALAGCSAGGSPSTDAPWLTGPTREAHALFFPLLATGHTAVDCNQCHTSPDTFARVDCTTCHVKPDTDAIHVGAIVDYQWTTTACLGCHSDGTISPVDHASHFPITAGTSHALSCRECHSDALRRSDPATLLCAQCHATRPGFPTAHARVADYAATSPDCLKCHAELPVPTIADHQAHFPIAPGSLTHDTACLRCHGEARADKPFATDFSVNTCVSCHDQAETTTRHAAVADFRYDSPSCFQCHPSGTAATVDHEARFPIATGTAHAGIACADCHTVATRRGDVATLACASCHQRRDGALAGRHSGATIPVTDYVATPAGCVRCHADSQVDLGSRHPRGEDTPSGNSRHRTAGCTTCHSGFRSAKPWAATWGTTPGCRSCHRNGTP
jgi:hypothetical protein